MRRLSTVLLFAIALLSGSLHAQEIATAVERVKPEGTPKGQVVIDLTTRTRHPAYLEAQALKTPEGLRIVASAVGPDNAKTCPRSGPSQAECKQVFRVTVDTGARCQASGEYEALFRVACWPGTAASLCKPGGHQHNFKLPAEPVC